MDARMALTLNGRLLSARVKTTEMSFWDFRLRGLKRSEGGGALNSAKSISSSYCTTSFKQAIYGSYGLLSADIGINRAGGYGAVPELLLDEP